MLVTLVFAMIIERIPISEIPQLRFYLKTGKWEKMIKINGIDYITDKEAAHLFGYSKQWFVLQRKNGRGPPFVQMNGFRSKVLYKLADITKWFELKTN